MHCKKQSACLVLQQAHHCSSPCPHSPGLSHAAQALIFSCPPSTSPAYRRHVLSCRRPAGQRACCSTVLPAGHQPAEGCSIGCLPPALRAAGPAELSLCRGFPGGSGRPAALSAGQPGHCSCRAAHATPHCSLQLRCGPAAQDIRHGVGLARQSGQRSTAVASGRLSGVMAPAAQHARSQLRCIAAWTDLSA